MCQAATSHLHHNSFSLGMLADISMATESGLFIGFAMDLQGGGQQALGTNWGDGFATDPAVVSSLGLSDPRPFFDALAMKPYADQVRPKGSARCRGTTCAGMKFLIA